MLSILRKPVSESCRSALSILRKPLICSEICQKQILVLNQTSIRHNTSLQPFDNVEKFAKIGLKYAMKDKVPHTYELIYKAPMDIYMTIMSAAITGFTVLTGFVLVYRGMYTMEDLNVTVSESHNIILATSKNEAIAAFTMSLALLVITKLLITRYVLRIYKYDKNYIAIFRGPLPGLIKKRYFEAGDFESVKQSRYVGWTDGLYKLGNRKAFLMVDYFKTPRDLKVMITDPEDLAEMDKGDY